MSRFGHVLVGVVTIVLLAGSCTRTEAGSGSQNQQSSQVPLIRLAAGPDGFPSPLTGRRLASIQAGLMFDTLVWKDATGSPIGWLAQSWEESSDGTQWTFHLHDGILWQDGTPLTASDVVFTYNYLISGPGRAAAGIFGSVFVGNFVGVVATTPDTVVFTMKQPWGTFLTGIAGLVLVLPQHIWGSVADPATFKGAPSVIGSGPYRLKSFDRATGSADFVANDSYFLGRPVVRQIEFVPAPDQLLALKKGNIDAANAGTEDQLPTQALDTFTSSRYGTVTGPSDWNRALHFNLNAGYPFNDVRFRQAVAYAVDRQDLVNRVLFGHGVPGSPGGLAPTNPYFAPSLPAYDHNVAMADGLLDAVGLVRPAGGGMRRLANGQPFTITLQTSSEFSNETAVLISEYLRSVGIAVTIDTLDPTTADSNAAAGTYQTTLVGDTGVGEDPDILLRIDLSPKTVTTVSKAHGYDNATVEALGQAEIFTENNVARKTDLQQIQRQVALDIPFISLYYPTPEEIFVRKVFSNWYFTPTGFQGFQTGVINKQAFVTGRKTGS